MKTTSWGVVAKWYDELLEQSGNTFQEKVILPNILRIVDPKPEMPIFDIACGQGYFTRAFQKTGANVSGCDISKELIDLAKEHTSSDTNTKTGAKSTVVSGSMVSLKPIAYYVAPAEKLPPLIKNFDVVTIVLAIQNISDMKKSFSEAFRALKPGGRLVIVINHPIFRIPQKTSWVWDEKSSTQYRRIDAYMSDTQTEIDMNPGTNKNGTNKDSSGIDKGGVAKISAFGAKTVSFHRPLQSYFKALSSTGFAVTRLEEWISHKQSQKGPRATEEDRIRKEIPLFMCIEARKI